MLVQEKYQREYSLNEYHYTLYYYDQAGNLVRTVAPKGVQKLTGAQVAQLQTSNPPTIYPVHTYVTNYKYQSYGAPLNSKTPDETDVTEYVYDNIGRIQLSVNAKQKNTSSYSYTLYDNLGRIEEVGVLTNVPSNITIADFKSHIAINDFRNFISTFTKTEVISTYYDAPLNTLVSSQFSNGGQQNLRNRVASVTYENINDNNSNTYNYATHYTYDEHGNVGRIIQDIPSLNPVGKEFYTLDYDYDLISGNVNKVTYQKGNTDQFMHKYEYDDDNRLHKVFTSVDNINWDRDAKYFYYEHGPLARTELGDQQVQGTDYAYTIHGWIKAVNSNALSKVADMGKDGAQGNRYLSNQFNLHKFVGKDAASYSLNYYQQNGLSDYQAIKSFNNTDNKNMLASTSNIMSSGTPFNFADDAPDLFNGNISSMVTSIVDIDLNSANTHAENTDFPQITAYKYDQLHRIKQMKAFRDISITNNQWNTANGSNYDGSYFTQFTYDKNGNIVTQKRDGAAFMTGLGLQMDNLTYITQDVSLTNPTNKLIGVNDATAGNYATDIKGTSSAVDGSPSTYDYDYDAIGSLIKDKKEFISNIEWTVDRKVKQVIRNGSLMASNGKNMPDIEFEYDANRQRVVKIVKPHDGNTGALLSQDNWIYTYYVRDASGNITATYNKSYLPVAGQPNTFTEVYKMQELDIYGSSRLGTIPYVLSIGNRDFTANIVSGVFQNINYLTNTITPPSPCIINITDPVSGAITTVPCPDKNGRSLGYRRYELTNHLGNVLSVVSDRKIQNGGNTIDLINDYEQSFVGQSALPIPLSGSNFCAKLNNSFSPNTITEVYVGDNITTNIDYYTVPSSTGELILSITDENGNFLYDNDPLDNVTGVLWLSTPVSINTSWQSLSINKTINAVFSDAARTIPYNGRIFINSHAWNPNVNDCWFDNHTIHISQAIPLVDSYTSEILETHDYYAFGMEMTGRSVGQDYSYGNNGQMRERETFEGAYSADYWGYDSRLGRRWNIDPLYYANQSPYATFNNNPILFSDPFGLEAQDQLPIKPNFLNDVNAGGGNAKHKQGKGPNGQKIQLPLNANVKYFKTANYKVPGSNLTINTPAGSIQSFVVPSTKEYVQEHGYVQLYNSYEANFDVNTGAFNGYFNSKDKSYYTPEKIFTNQQDAFEYLWSNSIQNKTENGIYILKSGLFIVTPNSNNTAGSTGSLLDYIVVTSGDHSYLWYDGKLEEILAVGHTHPVYMEGTTAEGGDAGGDCGFHSGDVAAAQRVAYTYHFVIGKDGTFDAVYVYKGDGTHSRFSLKSGSKKVTREDIIKGKINIIKFFTTRK